MVAINPHTTRATGTILTAVIYNGDHANHIANAQALNNGKIEAAVAPPVIADGFAVVFDGNSGASVKSAGAAPLTAIADGSVTYAKIQDVSATARILARKTAGAGDVEEATISEVLDFLGGAARGDIIYRGASDWNNLAAGVSGQFLQTLGNTADPVWADLPAAGLVRLASGTVSAAATLDLVLSAYTAYRGLLFKFSAFVPATDSVSFQARVSSDGGASYNAGATDYRYTSFGSFDDSATTTSATRSTGGSTITMTNGTVGNVASSEGIEGFVWLLNQTATGRHSRLHWDINAILENGVAHRCSGVGRRQTSQDTDAIRFLFSSGNIASGNYAVYGLS